MRCPKCRFTSFDDLAACAKCSNDLSIIAQELQGTCTETKLPFFLSSVVQIQESAEQTFSGSQALPPIDDTDINLEDTLTGEISLSTDADQTLTGLDESIEFSDDGISLELGDVMPIDLEQLDEPIDLEDGSAFDATDVLSLDNEEEVASSDDIDLNLTDDLSDLSADFDATEIISSDSFNKDLDLDLTGDFDESVGLDLSGDFEAFDLDETSIALEPGSDTEPLNVDDTFSEGNDLDLAEDLTLTGEFPSLDIDETEALELDGSLLDELSNEDDANFDLDETDISLDPTSDAEAFDADDTLDFDDTLLTEAVDEEQLGNELDLNLDELDSDLQDEELSLDDSLTREQEDEPSSDADDTLDFDDDTLQETGVEAADEEQLGDELLATMDDELDLNLDEQIGRA